MSYSLCLMHCLTCLPQPYISCFVNHLWYRCSSMPWSQKIYNDLSWSYPVALTFQLFGSFKIFPFPFLPTLQKNADCPFLILVTSSVYELKSFKVSSWGFLTPEGDYIFVRSENAHFLWNIIFTKVGFQWKQKYTKYYNMYKNNWKTIK